MTAFEANFDGLVGPTHNYAGLSHGNLASSNNKALISNPKQAAKQGLLKMKTLADLGLVQGVLPPQLRPDIKTLKQLGYRGSDKEILEKTLQHSPHMLSAVNSASSMWAANAATVSASADTYDHKVHFTPANLISKFHRAIEPQTTSKILAAIFNNPNHFVHHPHLPATSHFSDEGAANHSRLCTEHEQMGATLFVCGRYGFEHDVPDTPDSTCQSPQRFPARQTFEASQAIAHQHGLQKVVFARQNPQVIDMGVFHNDVIAVAHRNILFCHESAWVDQDKVIQQLNHHLDQQLKVFQVSKKELSIENAIKSYLFNSQLLTLKDQSVMLLMPQECQKNPEVLAYLQSDAASWIDQQHFLDLRQSMRNGGGPACLRLRVVLNQKELNAVNQSTLLDQILFDRLSAWVEKHYRDQLQISDLADPQLLLESYTALDQLTQILDLGSIYDFQSN
ncbi:N-succinylarginine dihydrolase [Pelagibaculum spongiae]|uniref:N-succinylarginine dihydrolase n=1 Tax=Pelagibaculum spongiae TaxID=2080658 RepID=A0A2V1GYS3_9GAMM|nr:N-succinylarginine dihydrolase [Pelagibaculum spongiae]PVZ72204.1 N-succinylarginine dihydrolase [Pelagibaculum spongiae]